MQRWLISATVLAILGLLAAAEPAGQEDPAASKLLAEARAARAHWERFPGFTADIEINFDGQLARGKATVLANGRVGLERLDPEKEAWARRVLGTTIAHRLDESASRHTPCAFVDQELRHPLGRAIRVLNDELHSSYRIRDQQILEVNRTTPEGRFTISVLENRKNAEGKYLPITFVVSYFDGQGLSQSEVHQQTWQRLDRFDLPVTTTVVSTRKLDAPALAKKAYAVQTLTLSNHQLPK